jgi:anti-sigma regulatory factor (Ser/Thr protein kinase)
MFSRHPPEAMTFVYTTNLSEVRVLAETQARQAGLDEDRIVDFVIAVSEIAANTVRHARTQGSIEIWSDAGEIICEMRDGGVIADPESVGRQPPAADASGGHGLWLARQICDKVELHSDSNGTIIRLHMSLPPSGPQARDSPGPTGGATTRPDVAL